ncbi:MAG TPA: hypothetical protein ENK23_04290 [Sorangium sp.]|nr:hypothetical protein [Sorangium sp.]
MKPSAVTSLVAGARLGWTRLWGRSLGGLLLLSVAFTVTVALVERRLGSAAAVTRVVMTLARWVIPLGAFSLLWQVRGGRRLQDACWPLARFGYRRRAVASGAIMVASGVAAAVALLSCGAGLWLVRDKLHGAGEVWICLRVCVLASLAYAAAFGCAGNMGRGGRGCWVLLLADLLLGAGAGWPTWPFPRAHVRSLFGGAAVTGFSQATSSVSLWLIVVASWLWLMARLPD